MRLSNRLIRSLANCPNYGCVNVYVYWFIGYNLCRTYSYDSCGIERIHLTWPWHFHQSMADIYSYYFLWTENISGTVGRISTSWFQQVNLIKNRGLPPLWKTVLKYWERSSESKYQCWTSGNTERILRANPEYHKQSKNHQEGMTRNMTKYITNATNIIRFRFRLTVNRNRSRSPISRQDSIPNQIHPTPYLPF